MSFLIDTKPYVLGEFLARLWQPVPNNVIRLPAKSQRPSPHKIVQPITKHVGAA